VENPFEQNPFREEEAGVEDVEDARDQNPYTIMEGYELEDASGTRVGEVEETVYDAVSDVLKYVVVNGRAVPANGIEVNAEEGRVRVPYEGETIESAPALEDPSGEFDRTLRAHYENR
jgi:sporulation protein YlmC with PRC-barrel domain